MKKCIGTLTVLAGLTSVFGAQPSQELEKQSRDAAKQHAAANSQASGVPVAEPPNDRMNAGAMPGLPAGIDEVDVEAVLQQILSGRGEDYDPTKPVGVRRLERALQEIAALLAEIRAGGLVPVPAPAEPIAAAGATPAQRGSASAPKVPVGYVDSAEVGNAEQRAAVPLAETVADHARRIEQIERDLEALKSSAVPAVGAPVLARRPE